MRDRRGRIFLSYRRADSAAIVDHLYERLLAKYGRKCLFRDLDDIPLGKNFRDHVREVIAGCDIVLAIIGKQWSGGKGRLANRIMEEDDPVRIELEVANEAGAWVIPVLVGGALMPTANTLPATLSRFPELNAATLATGQDFEHHLGMLMREIDRVLRNRGKTVVPRPDWLTPAVSAATTLACAPPLLFLASALFEIPFSGGVVTVGVFVMTLAAAMATAMFAVDALLSGRIGWSEPQQRPILAGALLFLLAFPAFYWLGDRLAAEIPIRDPDHLATQLLAEFRAARDDQNAAGESDFATAREIVDAMLRIDPDNGTAWYFAGEIERRGTPELFDSQSCFTGAPENGPLTLDRFQDDFLRYRDKDMRLGATTASDWGTEICYQGQGFCPQRTAWISHLLAYDNFMLAQSSGAAERRALLESARRYAEQAMRFQRPEGGLGFTQCMDTTVLRDRLDAELADEK